MPGSERSLTVSGLDWTLVEVPSLPAGLRIDDFSRAGDVRGSGGRQGIRLRRSAARRSRLGLHKRQCLRLVP
ncbi:Uncharacterised protein [Pseudomonas aeruginosa]|nr:Uncharacterised protein [Pseudomonas aeruginosa]